jgi:hypothetical protein
MAASLTIGSRCGWRSTATNGTCNSYDLPSRPVRCWLRARAEFTFDSFRLGSLRGGGGTAIPIAEHSKRICSPSALDWGYTEASKA